VKDVVLTSEKRNEIFANFFAKERQVRWILGKKLFEKGSANPKEDLDNEINLLMETMLSKGLTDAVNLANYWGSDMGNNDTGIRRTSAGGFNDTIKEVFLADLPGYSIEAEIETGMNYVGESSRSQKGWFRQTSDKEVMQHELFAQLKANMQKRPDGDKWLTAYTLKAQHEITVQQAEEFCGAPWNNVRKYVRRECRNIGIELETEKEDARTRSVKIHAAGRESTKRIASQKKEKKFLGRMKQKKNLTSLRRCLPRLSGSMNRNFARPS
jgi:hypothetical protein